MFSSIDVCFFEMNLLLSVNKVSIMLRHTEIMITEQEWNMVRERLLEARYFFLMSKLQLHARYF